MARSECYITAPSHRRSTSCDFQGVGVSESHGTVSSEVEKLDAVEYGGRLPPVERVEGADFLRVIPPLPHPRAVNLRSSSMGNGGKGALLQENGQSSKLSRVASPCGLEEWVNGLEALCPSGRGSGVSSLAGSWMSESAHERSGGILCKGMICKGQEWSTGGNGSP